MWNTAICGLLLLATLTANETTNGRWAMRRRVISVYAGPGPFYPIVDHLRVPSKGPVKLRPRDVELKILRWNPTGRWAEIAGWIARGPNGSERIVPLKNAQHGWVPKIALRPITSTNRVVNVARVSADDIKALRVSAAASIRGLRDDALKIMKRTNVNPDLVRWIAAPKFTIGELERFCSARQIGRAGLKIVVPGEENLPELDPEAQDELGRVAAARVAEQIGGAAVKDAKLLRYINLVATVLGAVSSRYDIAYKVIVVRSDRVNSYSTPGGYVVVTTGLLRICRDESELGGALTHEIAHIARGHGLRERENLQKETGGIDILGSENELENAVRKMLGRSSEAFHTINAKELNTMLAWFRGVTISRKRRLKDEKEADEYALVYLARAGYDPDGLRRFVDRLGQKFGYDSSAALTCHASPRQRLQQIAYWTRKFGLRSRPDRRFADAYETEVLRRLQAKTHPPKPKTPRKPHDPFAELGRLIGEIWVLY